MKKRRIVFHIGGPKTGSTALQLFLSVNAENLRDRGIDYVDAPQILPPSWATSGNGTRLFELLRSGKCSQIDLDSAVDGYFKLGHMAICSSELFVRLDAEQWTNLRHSCRRLNLAATIVMFVRDPYSYCYSLYHEAVRARGEVCTFAEFLFRPFDWHASALRRVTSLFGKRNIRVLHYDSLEAQVESAFSELVDIDYATLTKTPWAHRVNRSLGRAELGILLLANRILGPGYSGRLSEMMMYHLPDAPAHSQLDSSIIEVIERRFSDDVAWVNRTYFNSRDIVTIVGGYSSKALAENQAPEGNSAESRALAWAFREIAGLNVRLNEDITTRIHILLQDIRALCADKTLSKSPGIPENFDPIIYLICNPDLVVAGVNPYQHFLVAGKNEDRRWQLMDWIGTIG